MQAGPAEGVGPGEADGAVAFVARAGRGAFAAGPVAGVDAPQAAEAADPGGVVVDEDRLPFAVLAGADAGAVAAGVVDEGDAEAVVLAAVAAQQHLGAALPPAGGGAEEARVDGDEVVAGEEGAGMGAGAGEHHGVGALGDGQVRIVPAAAEVVAGVVVGGEGDPARGHGAGLGGSQPVLGEVDRHHLPVGLVVVDAAEGGAPVVGRVEVPVLQDDVAALAQHAAVVRGRLGAAAGLVLLGGLGHHPAGDGAADQQAQTEQDVDEARDEADGRQAAGAADAGGMGLAPAADLAAAGGFEDVAEEQGAVGVPVRGVQQAREVELAGRDEFGLLVAVAPEARRRRCSARCRSGGSTRPWCRPGSARGCGAGRDRPGTEGRPRRAGRAGQSRVGSRQICDVETSAKVARSAAVIDADDRSRRSPGGQAQRVASAPPSTEPGRARPVLRPRRRDAQVRGRPRSPRRRSTAPPTAARSGRSTPEARARVVHVPAGEVRADAHHDRGAAVAAGLHRGRRQLERRRDRLGGGLRARGCCRTPSSWRRRCCCSRRRWCS